jgi:hypothetical protein
MMGMKPKTDQEYHGPWSVDNSQFVETAQRQKRRRLWIWSAASAKVLHIGEGLEGTDKRPVTKRAETPNFFLVDRLRLDIAVMGMAIM